MIKKYLKQFIECHYGILNRILHIIGFSVIGVGIYYKSLIFVLTGAVIQELGHFYQYAKTGKFRDSPWHCLKPQSLFAYPILILIIVYVLIG